MDLKEFYYRIRPLARVRAEQRILWAESDHKKQPTHPAIGFIIGAFFSLVGGLFGGTALWLAAGFSPDNSGGTPIFIFGSIAMSLISLPVYVIWKHRGTFYGLNAFTALTMIALAIEAATALLT